MIRAIKLVQAVENILGRVAVDNVEKNDNPQSMCGINELLEVVRGAVSAACCKEAVDLVSEAGIIGVFHDGHQLNDIVSELLDPGEHILRKLLVGRHSQFRGGDSNMRLVYSHALRLLWPRVLENISFGLGRVPEPGFVHRRYGEVLGNVFDPCWNSIDFFARGQDQ